MRIVRPACLVGLLFAALGAGAPEKPASGPAEYKPHPATITFYIDGMTCEGCAACIAEAVKKVPSVTAVEIPGPKEGYARVSFDTHRSSYHQVAQAIAKAGYKPSLRFQIPDYAKGENTAKVDAVFQRLSDRVTIETVDRAEGKFVLRFLPLEVDPKLERPQGFNGGHLGHPIHDPAPKGLALKIIWSREQPGG